MGAYGLLEMMARAPRLHSRSLANLANRLLKSNDLGDCPAVGNRYLSTIDAAAHKAEDDFLECCKEGLHGDRLGRIVDLQS